MTLDNFQLAQLQELLQRIDYQATFCPAHSCQAIYRQVDAIRKLLRDNTAYRDRLAVVEMRERNDRFTLRG